MALTLTSERRISCLFPGTPIVIQHLNGLNIVLDKAAAWAAPRKVNAADLLNMRLSPDLGGTICRRFVEALDAIDHENLLPCLHRQGFGRAVQRVRPPTLRNSSRFRNRQRRSAPP
jgi:hypothetical protein